VEKKDFLTKLKEGEALGLGGKKGRVTVRRGSVVKSEKKSGASSGLALGGGGVMQRRGFPQINKAKVRQGEGSAIQ